MPLTDLSTSTKSRLKAVLPEFGTVGNPADVTAQVITNTGMLGDVIEILMDDGGTGCVMLFLGGSGDQADTLIDSLQQLTKSSAKPLLVAWSGVPHEVRVRASEAGVNVFSDSLRPLRPLGAVMNVARRSATAAEVGTLLPTHEAHAGLTLQDFQQVTTARSSSMMSEASSCSLKAASRYPDTSPSHPRNWTRCWRDGLTSRRC